MAKIWGKDTSTETPGAKQAQQEGDPPPAKPAREFGTYNTETADAAGTVVPHNEALAQHPASNATEQLRDAEKFLKETQLGRLQAWRKKVELGGPRSADWDEFEALLNEKPDASAKVARAK